MDLSGLRESPLSAAEDRATKECLPGVMLCDGRHPQRKQYFRMDLFETGTGTEEQDRDIRIGTSGYSFQDWRGVFYPDNLPNNKMLDLYMRHFATVEINATYYGIPRPSVFASMAARAPEHFDFMVKVPESFTHRREQLERDRDRFLQAIEPLRGGRRLAGLLAQFPFSFRFGTEELHYLSIIKQVIEPTRLFVEFRHESWLNRAMYDHLRTESIGYVSVDEPPLPGLIPPHAFATTPTAYVRLHGRNGAQWWTGGALRYDYRYSSAELEEWGKKVVTLQAKGETTYVFFNNCHQGHAVLNARDFRRIIRTLRNRGN